MFLSVKTVARISKQCVAAFLIAHAIMYSNTQQTPHQSLSYVKQEVTLSGMR